MNRKWTYIIITGILILFLFRVRVILTPFFFAGIIAYIAYPLVKLFETKEVPRPTAILLVYLIFGIITGLTIYFLIPQLIRELEEILKFLPGQTERLEGIGQDALRNLQRIRIPETLQEGANLVLERIQIILESLANRLAELLLGGISQIFSLIISPFLAFYLLRDLEIIKRRTIMLIPKTYRSDVYHLAKESNKVLTGFIRGQLLISALVGLLITAGLSLVGIRYALFIGVLAGLFDIIPYFGPIIGIIPAVVIGLLKSPTTVFWVLVVFLAVNQIEASIVAPKVMGDRVGLHPLAVIFAVLAGGELMGIMGMLLAVPVAAMIRVLYLYLLKKIDKQAI